MSLQSEITTTFEIKEVPIKVTQKATDSSTSQVFRKTLVFKKDKPDKSVDLSLYVGQGNKITFLAFQAQAYEYTDCEKQPGFTLYLGDEEPENAVQPVQDIVYAAQKSFPLPVFTTLTVKVKPKMFTKADEEITATVSFGIGPA